MSWAEPAYAVFSSRGFPPSALHWPQLCQLLGLSLPTCIVTTLEAVLASPPAHRARSYHRGLYRLSVRYPKPLALLGLAVPSLAAGALRVKRPFPGSYRHTHSTRVRNLLVCCAGPKPCTGALVLSSPMLLGSGPVLLAPVVRVGPTTRTILARHHDHKSRVHNVSFHLNRQVTGLPVIKL